MSTAPAAFVSERLRYRPIREDDAELFVKLYSDPALMRHVAAALAPDAARRALAGVLAGMRAAPARCCFLVIEALRDDARLGIVGCPDLGALPDLEIGVVLLSPASGQGHGRESLSALADQLFRRDAVRSLWTRIEHANGAAIRMVESIGFRPSAGLREASPGHGIWTRRRADAASAMVFGGHRNPAMTGSESTGRLE